MNITRALSSSVSVISLSVILAGCVTYHSPRLSNAHAQQDAAADNVQLAMAYMQANNLPRAKEKIDKALQEDPTNANAHSVLALFYERVNDSKKAESEFREAMRLAPGDPGPQNFYGVYLCGQHRVDEGVTKLLQVATNPLYRTPEAAYTNVGVCLRTAHRDEEAESAFHRALTVRPDFAEATYQLADLELAHGRALEARDRIARYLGQFNPTADLLLLGWRAARTLGDARSVAQYAKTLRTEFPDSEQARSLSAEPTG
jgi:type IV pilus assembly protein PilF